MDDNKLARLIFKVSDSFTKQLRFNSNISCPGEVLIGDLYVLGEITKTGTITDGTDRGADTRAEMNLGLDVTGVPLGDYALKIHTAETGVIAKAMILIR